MLPGGSELILILVVVILLFGGRELPRIARTIGRWSAILRKSINDVRREFNRLSIEEEMRQSAEAFKKAQEETMREVQGEQQQPSASERKAQEKNRTTDSSQAPLPGKQEQPPSETPPSSTEEDHR